MQVIIAGFFLRSVDEAARPRIISSLYTVTL